jgi:hypothetical protein
MRSYRARAYDRKVEKWISKDLSGKHPYEKHLRPTEATPCKRICIKCLKNQVYYAPNGILDDKICSECK